MALPKVSGEACSSDDLPEVMRAVVRGSAGEFTFEESYVTPALTSTSEIIVDVKAAAINPVDYKVGKMLLGPQVGLDFAGIVKRVGTGVTQLAAGDAVYGTAAGSLADFVVVDAGRVAKKPLSLSYQQAAAMPTAYLTGLQSLRAGGVVATSKVLVIGASGGCGSAGVQIAKALGAKEVVGVSSVKNAEMVSSQGADRVIDYQTQSIADEPADYDVVYDTATNSGGGEDYRASGRALLRPPQGQRRSQYVAINGKLSVWLRKFVGWQEQDTQLILTDANTKDLETLAQMTDGNEQRGRKLSPVISKILPFEPSAIDEGFALLKSRRTVGKIVFEM